jgi:hypothetical protein
MDVWEVEDARVRGWQEMSPGAIRMLLERSGYDAEAKMENIKGRASLNGEEIEYPGITGPMTLFVRCLHVTE